MMAMTGSKGSGPVSPLSITIADYETSPTNPSASLGTNSNGTIVNTGNQSSTSPNWYAPTTTGIGSSFWCQLIHNSGFAVTSGSAVGSILAMSAALNWNWNTSLLGMQIGTYTLKIYSDSGGSNEVSSTNFTVTIEKDSGA